MNCRIAVGAFLTAIALACATPAAHAQPIPVNLHVGDFTYQFADPVTGQPIASLGIGNIGGAAKVAVYLIQTGGTPSDLLRQLGAEGLGVRLNYASPAGTVRVPSITNANITARPPPTFNPNGISSDYDFIQRTGTGTGSDTTLSASITEGIFDPTAPLPFPGTEDPLANKTRMLIGTFNLQVLSPAIGQGVPVTAMDPFAGVQILSGPNPPIIAARNDGTNGPVPGNGAQGEIQIDQYLTQYLPTPVIPTLFVQTPEPSSLGFGLLAAAGLAIWRRRSARADSL